MHGRLTQLNVRDERPDADCVTVSVLTGCAPSCGSASEHRIQSVTMSVDMKAVMAEGGPSATLTVRLLMQGKVRQTFSHISQLSRSVIVNRL